MGLELDKAELANLQGVISSAEAHLATASDASRPLLNNLLQNAQNRLNALETKLAEAEKEQAQQKDNITAAVLERQKLVARETALSSSEKQTYGQFLAEEFFTKKDFGRLDSFYGKTWDRLSEGGKEQMSHRVWEGVRQGEYTFAELPKNVREKESERFYLQVTGKEKSTSNLGNITAQDRTDFVREYEAGNQKAVAEVLGRKSFSENLGSRTAVSKGDTAASKEKNSGGNLDLAKEKQVGTVSKSEGNSITFDEAQPSISPTALNRSSGQPSVTR